MESPNPWKIPFCKICGTLEEDLGDYSSCCPNWGDSKHIDKIPPKKAKEILFDSFLNGSYTSDYTDRFVEADGYDHKRMEIRNGN